MHQVPAGHYYYVMNISQVERVSDMHSSYFMHACVMLNIFKINRFLPADRNLAGSEYPRVMNVFTPHVRGIHLSGRVIDQPCLAASWRQMI